MGETPDHIYDREEVTHFHIAEFYEVLGKYRDQFLADLFMQLELLENMQLNYYKLLRSPLFSLDNFREYSAKGACFIAGSEETRIYEILKHNNTEWTDAIGKFHAVLGIWQSQLQGITDFLKGSDLAPAAALAKIINAILEGQRKAIPAGKNLHEVSRHEAVTSIRDIIASGTEAYQNFHV